MTYMLLFFVGMALVIHFMITKPSRKKHDKKALMLNSIMKGDIIYTGDGLRGTVDRVNGAAVTVALMPDGKRVTIDLEEIKEVENYDVTRAEFLMDQKIRRNKAKSESRQMKERVRKEAMKEEKRQDRRKRLDAAIQAKHEEKQNKDNGGTT